MLGLRGGPVSKELSCVRSMDTCSRGDLRSCRICWQSCGRIWLVLRMVVSVQVCCPLINIIFDQPSQRPTPTLSSTIPQFTLNSTLSIQARQELPRCISISRLEPIVILFCQPIGEEMTSRHDSRIDPLELLRATYSEGRRARLREGVLVFEKEVRLDLMMPTPWIAAQSRKNYALGSLWLCLEHLLGKTPNYLERAAELSLDNVIVSDRKDIEEYFIRGRAHASCIDQRLKLQLSTKTHSRVREQPASGFEGSEAPSKRQKTDLSGDLQVIDFISKFERPVSSKSRSLRCPSKSLEPLLKLLHGRSEEGGRVDERRLRIGRFMEGKQLPIIIVPEGQQPGTLCLANVEKFLGAGEYVADPPRLPDHQRKCEIVLPIRGRKVRFEVCNNPPLMPPSDWPSVVAVFVQGRKHEFQGWPCTDPALIFQQARGFRLRFTGKQEGEAEQWNVKQFTLDRNFRYRDAGIQREIMGEIEGLLYEAVEG